MTKLESHSHLTFNISYTSILPPLLKANFELQPASIATHTDTQRERETDRDRDRQTDRQRETDRQTERDRQRQRARGRARGLNLQKS